MRKRKPRRKIGASTPIKADAQTISDNEDFCAPDVEELQLTSRRPKYAPLPFDSIPCATTLANIFRDALNPKWRGVSLISSTGKTGNGFAAQSLKKLIPNRRAAEQKLGRELLNALLAGDKQFADQVAEAVREVDMLFNRTRLADLTDRIMPFSSDVDACATKLEARTLIEKRLGKSLYNEEWDRLQYHFGWHRKRKGSKHQSHKRGRFEVKDK